MWRSAVAAALLFLLVALVADMLFGGSRSLGTVDRYPPPPTWYGAERDALLAGRPSAIDAARFPTAAGTPLSEPPTGPTADSGLAGADVQPVDTVLARRPEVGETLPWPGQVAPLPPAESASVDVKETTLPPAEKRSGGGVRQATVAPAPPQAPRSQVMEAQRQLATLGYDPGPADGRSGRRTDAAVRNFQRDIGNPVTGRIDAQLLAHLETEHRMRAHLRQQELEAMSPAPPPKMEKPKQERGIFGAVLGGVQRLMGRDFDSVRRPDELAAYCRSNTDTWIYDFGREAFVYCGNVLAGQTAAVGGETAAGR